LAEKSKKIPISVSFIALVWSDPFRLYGKALRILKLDLLCSWRWRFGVHSLHRLWL